MTSLITGLITLLATFPGVVVRQAIVQLLCFYYQIPVFQVAYFRLWPPGGAVVYEPPASVVTAMALMVGPFVVNSLLGTIMGFSAVFGLLEIDGEWTAPLDLFLIWLGVSIAVHAFPTLQEAQYFEKSRTNKSASVQAAGGLVVAAAHMAALSRIVWVDVIYAVGMVVGLPVLAFELSRFAF
jgi:hypothetical protein